MNELDSLVESAEPVCTKRHPADLENAKAQFWANRAV